MVCKLDKTLVGDDALAFGVVNSEFVEGLLDSFSILSEVFWLKEPNNSTKLCEFQGSVSVYLCKSRLHQH